MTRGAIAAVLGLVVATWPLGVAAVGVGPVAVGAVVSPSASASASAASDVALHDCRLPGWPQAVRCGTLRRPLDPARPDGTAIGVAYVVVPALARQKRPEPVFFVAGGPGQSAIDLVPQVMPLFSRLNNRRDLVFVDQRGTGRSEPLTCDDDAATPDLEMGEDDEASVQMQLRALARCRAALERRPTLREPGALGHFTTPVAVQDLDAVRRALGAARIDLVGVSYGTRVILEVLRQRPETVRRAVLDSVAPPDLALPSSFSTDGQAALDALFAACEREAACRDRWPSLRADWQGLLRRLPMRVTGPDPSTGVPTTVTWTRERVLGAVRGALYGPAVAAALPAAIGDAAAGRMDGLRGLAALFASRRGPAIAVGMHFSVTCAEDVRALDRWAAARDAGDRPGADFGRGSETLYRRACATWPVGDVPDGFFTVGPTSVRTLLLSGGLDPATPPRHARRVARALGASAQWVEVPNGGHALLGVGCTPELLQRFLDADESVDDLASPAARPPSVDAGCLVGIPRPPAFQPPTTRPRAAPAEPPGPTR